MPILTVPRVLREKLGDDGADALVSLINEAGVNQRTDTLALAEEKFERRLSGEVGKLDRRITEEVGKLDRRITEEVAKLRVEMARMRADLIRWMFIFWIGQIGAPLGILFAFFRT